MEKTEAFSYYRGLSLSEASMPRLPSMYTRTYFSIRHSLSRQLDVTCRMLRLKPLLS